MFARYGLDDVILSLDIPWSLRLFIHLNPWRFARHYHLSQAEAIRRALEELGPIFIKFGQAISTRRDLLSTDIADELVKLQDRVPPFPGEDAKKIVESTFKKSIHELFASFELLPLASASIAQVHAAKNLSGENVVVKVVRPGIKKKIRQDLQLLFTIAHLMEKYWQDGKRLRPVEVVGEFEKTIIDELNLMQEAANASQLRRNFSNSNLLYVPKIYWTLTTDNILVMERIHGIPVTDIAQLKQRGVNIKKLAERGVEIFFTQVLRDSFFHADMHPGNIFVSYDHPEDPQYICVDFGIMGNLTERDKYYLAENFHAFFQRDYRRVAELHVESGWVPINTRIDDFESAIRTVCEPIFERPLGEISCAQMLLRLFQTGRRFNMPAQPQLVLLQKTLFAIEGLGRELYPELDLWVTAKPFLEKWVGEQYKPQAIFNYLKRNLAESIYKIPEIPRLLHDQLTLSKQSLLLDQEKNLKQEVSDYSRKIVIKGMSLAFLISALMTAWFDPHLHIQSFTVSWLTGSFVFLGIITLLISGFRK